MRMAFFFDQTRCLSCKVCSLGCKDWHQVSPGPVRWRTAKTYESDNSPYFSPLSMSCNHCEDPACVAACASGAIIKRPVDGIVYIDRDKCTGLQTCISACPFAATKIADEIQEPDWFIGWQVAHPMQKCDFCKDRLDEWKKPICVESCPVFALEIGDYDELRSKYPDAEPLSTANAPFAYVNNTKNTGPSFLINKRKPLIFTKNI